MSNGTAIPQDKLLAFVGSQAAIQFNVLGPDDRQTLLAGLRIILPRSEYEQCEILEAAITDAALARALADEAQLLLGDMLCLKKS